MAVLQGLKTTAESSPDFSNTATRSLIDAIITEDSTYNFVSRVYYLIKKAESSADITNAQRVDLNSSLDTQSHLNIGRYLYDLEQQTNNILNGSLGEPDIEGSTGTFLEHLSLVQSFISTIPSLYGVTADSLNKGLAGHFGTLNGILDNDLISLKNTVDHISSFGLSQDTAYQSAVQAVSDFIDTMDGSSVDDISTYNALLSALETAAGNFNTALTTGYFSPYRITLLNIRSKITTQISLEQTNLGSLNTYESTLATSSSYLNFAGDADIRSLLIRTSQNSDWKSYFENYVNRSANDNPIYNNATDDSVDAEIIESVLRLRGLPDVTDYVDLESVAAKALRDTRLSGTLSDSGKTTAQIIADACLLLDISIDNKDVYEQSKSLLANMTENDREIVKTELDLHNQVNTLS